MGGEDTGGRKSNAVRGVAGHLLAHALRHGGPRQCLDAAGGEGRRVSLSLAVAVARVGGGGGGAVGAHGQRGSVRPRLPRLRGNKWGSDAQVAGGPR